MARGAMIDFRSPPDLLTSRQRLAVAAASVMVLVSRIW